MKHNKYFKIIYEDNSIIVIDKETGILTIPDRYNHNLPSLSQILSEIYGNIFVVHRLDKDTSGIMLFAKDADAHKELNIAFENNEIKRIYHVITQGIIPQDYIEIDIPLVQSRQRSHITIPSAKGKSSLTKLKVLKRFKNATLAECELVTGRHHQIRAHLQAIGYPLLIDELYGNNSSFFVSSIKRRYNLKKETEEQPLISRLTMHSYSIEFIHPENKEQLQFVAKYPKDFAALLQILEKYS
ncbi:MAG TPA: RluA family pseudouridine synthase [Candidatus Kapabacteria bacterium]|jgi:RluA family pseudouridine synthase|nr:RluA family pseudouridine synthase [Candidatus Kapabacteria bacterium]HOV91908.1 RluA family pseudouridine synthase [Candidatus Kapabacteria bacterium]